MPAALRLEGREFVNWYVLCKGTSTSTNSKWTCVCKCGTRCDVLGFALVNGDSTSCGCRRAEEGCRHGLSATSPLYCLWRNMISRCEDESNASYGRYGARGITVCDRWHDIRLFIADMDNRPSPKHQIERVDNDGPYSPENCAWATSKQQARNRRSNLPVCIDGVTKCLREWAEHYGHVTKAQYRLLWQRINRDSWTLQKALEAPPK